MTERAAFAGGDQGYLRDVQYRTANAAVVIDLDDA